MRSVANPPKKHHSEELYNFSVLCSKDCFTGGLGAGSGFQSQQGSSGRRSGVQARLCLVGNKDAPEHEELVHCESRTSPSEKAGGFPLILTGAGSGC